MSELTVLEQKIERIKEQITNADAEWKEREERLRAQFNTEYGAHLGRVQTLNDVLAILEEKNDENYQGQNENVVENPPESEAEK